jgi:putative DNA-invertase from lambdoid prophage Rac
VGRLEAMGVRVHCLALSGVDLTSPAGKMTMSVIAAVAQFERELLIERTLAGKARAREAGTPFGRKPTFDNDQRAAVRQRLEAGVAVAAVAREFSTSRQTIMRARHVVQDGRPRC